MACSDVPRFRAELLRWCTPLSSPECHRGISQAVGTYGDQCLLLPLYATVATAPVAAYVCPTATGVLATRCEAVAPGLVATAPRPGGSAPGGSAPGAEQQGNSTALIAGGSVAGLGVVGGAFEYYRRMTPYLDQLHLDGDDSKLIPRIQSTKIGAAVTGPNDREYHVYTNPQSGQPVRKFRIIKESGPFGFGTTFRLQDVDGKHEPGFVRRRLKSTWATRSGSGSIRYAKQQYNQDTESL